MPNPLSTTLPLLIAATVFCYVGTRLLWLGFGGQASSRPILRGMSLALLLGLLAVWMAFHGSVADGIAIVLSGSVVMMTLGLGLAAMSRPTNDGIGSTSLRALPPLCAAVCLAGFSGTLSIDHAVMLAVLGGALAWMLLPQDNRGRPLAMKPMGGGVIVSGIGVAVMILVASRLIDTHIWPITGPVFVLLILLSAVGLLAGDAHVPSKEVLVDTIVGYVIASLGIGLPLLILLGHALNLGLSPAVATTMPSATLPTTLPATQPAAMPIIMPLVSWRIDSVLLTALSIFLIPVGVGRVTLGRIEGTLLVLVSLLYIVASVGVIHFR